MEDRNKLNAVLVSCGHQVIDYGPSRKGGGGGTGSGSGGTTTGPVAPPPPPPTPIPSNSPPGTGSNVSKTPPVLQKSSSANVVTSSPPKSLPPSVSPPVGRGGTISATVIPSSVTTSKVHDPGGTGDKSIGSSCPTTPTDGGQSSGRKSVLERVPSDTTAKLGSKRKVNARHSLGTASPSRERNDGQDGSGDTSLSPGSSSLVRSPVARSESCLQQKTHHHHHQQPAIRVESELIFEPSVRNRFSIQQSPLQPMHQSTYNQPIAHHSSTVSTIRMNESRNLDSRTVDSRTVDSRTVESRNVPDQTISSGGSFPSSQPVPPSTVTYQQSSELSAGDTCSKVLSHSSNVKSSLPSSSTDAPVHVIVTSPPDDRSSRIGSGTIGSPGQVQLDTTGQQQLDTRPASSSPMSDDNIPSHGVSASSLVSSSCSSLRMTSDRDEEEETESEDGGSGRRSSSRTRTFHSSSETESLLRRSQSPPPSSASPSVLHPKYHHHPHHHHHHRHFRKDTT